MRVPGWEGDSGEDYLRKKSMRKTNEGGKLQSRKVYKALWITLELPALWQIFLGKNDAVQEMKYKKNVLNKYPTYSPWLEIRGWEEPDKVNTGRLEV